MSGRLAMGALGGALALTTATTGALALAAATTGALALAPATTGALVLAPATTGAAAAAQLSRSHLVVIVGAAGGAVYEEVFHNWGAQLVTVATENFGLGEEQVIYLNPDPALAPDLIDAPSSRDDVTATLTRVASNAAPDDRVFIVLIGHGSGAGEQSKFNLPGRDLSAIEYDALLDLFVTQEVAFVNTSSGSGDFAAVLSGPNRAIVTATRDARQNNQTVFPRFFVEAFAADVSDFDKDGRVSLLEAYNYAASEVQRFYQDDGRLRTETAQLEDDGDGTGSHEPTGIDIDGAFAALLFLGNPPGTTTAAGQTDDPELRRLYDEQRALRERIEQLRRIKATMDPQVYESELESVLVELALKDREIRAKGGSP